MLFSDDMKELIQLMNRHGVQYAMVGGFAVNYHGYVRTTQATDFLVYPSQKKAVRVVST